MTPEKKAEIGRLVFWYMADTALGVAAAVADGSMGRVANGLSEKSLNRRGNTGFTARLGF